MSQFDPNSFLDATTKEQSSKRPPIRNGAILVGTIGDIKARAWVGKKDPTQSGFAIDVPIEIDLSQDPSICREVLGDNPGQTKVTLTHGIMLDTTPAGGLDYGPGKNNGLRKYREALDMNKDGVDFAPRMMQGRQIRVKIKHETYEGDVYDRVDSVVKV